MFSSFLVHLIWWFVHFIDFINSLLSFTADIFCAGVWQNNYYLFGKWVFRSFLVLAIWTLHSEYFWAKSLLMVFIIVLVIVLGIDLLSHMLWTLIYFPAQLFFTYFWIYERCTIIIYFSSEIIKKVAKITNRPQLTSLIIFFTELS